MLHVVYAMPTAVPAGTMLRNVRSPQRCVFAFIQCCQGACDEWLGARACHGTICQTDTSLAFRYDATIYRPTYSTYRPTVPG